MSRENEQPDMDRDMDRFRTELTALCRSMGTVRFVCGRGMAMCGLVGETVVIHTF
jgi:hypothetical protein